MKVDLKQFETWLQNKSLQDRTIEEYIYYLIKFLPLGVYNQESVGKFLSEKSNRNNVARAFLKNFQKFLSVNYKELLIGPEERMDIAEVEIPNITGRKKERLVKPLSEEQILEIEKYLPDEKERLMLLLSYYGGLRVGELLKIQVTSFNWEEWKKDPEQVGECRVFGKGNKEGIAFFPGWLMRRVAKFIRTKMFTSLSSYIFLRNRDNIDGLNISNRTTSWASKLKLAAIKAGITQLDSNGNVIEGTGVHPHRLRHSWGSHLHSVKKMDIRNIQIILRHTSIRNTERYVHVEKGQIKELLKASYTPQQPKAETLSEYSEPQEGQTNTQQEEQRSSLTQ